MKGNRGSPRIEALTRTFKLYRDGEPVFLGVSAQVPYTAQPSAYSTIRKQTRCKGMDMPMLADVEPSKLMQLTLDAELPAQN